MSKNYFVFFLYYVLNIIPIAVILIAHDYLDLSHIVNKKFVDLKEDLQLDEEIFSKIYVVISSLLWPITRFIYIKPIITSSD